MLLEKENVNEVQRNKENESGTATCVIAARLGDKFEADGTVQIVDKERSEDLAL
jgi:hypothetical protein